MHVGIDLGTTYSSIARIDPRGQVMLLPDFHEADRFRTPSIVHLGPKGALVGYAAEALLEEDFSMPVVRFVKLKMGNEEPVFMDQHGSPWYAEGLSALILAKLRRDAEAFHDEPIRGVIIGVPRISPTRSEGQHGMQDSRGPSYR